MAKYITQAGRYRAIVERPTTGGWLSQTDSGAEFVRIPLVIHDSGDQDGCSIEWQGYISSDKSITRTSRMLLEALKAPANWFDLLAQGDCFLEGRTVLVTVEQKTKANANGGRELVYTKTGNPIFEATWLNDPDARPAAGAPLDRAKMSSLSRKLQAVAKSIQAEAGGASVPAQPAARPAAPARTVRADDPIELQDEDIPF